MYISEDINGYNLNEFCCDEFKELYDDGHLDIDGYRKEISLRIYRASIDVDYEYKLKCCPFCYRKIKFNKK